MTRTMMFAAAVAVALVASLSTRAGADDPVSSNVRFNREIIRILQRRCLWCHSPGGIAVSLASYRDVRDWGRAIREEIVEQRMPPVTAPPGSGRFEDPLGLTARETATLLGWIDGGMPRGDDRDLPPLTPDEAPVAGDVHIDLPEQQVPAREPMVMRRVTIDPRLTADRLVARVDVHPGSRAVMRAAFVYQGPRDNSWVGAWLPWQHTVAAPPARAFRLAKDAPLTVVLYYRGGEEPVVDRTTIDLHFADQAGEPLETLSIETGSTGTGQLGLKAATTIWGAHPLVTATTRSLELRARRPDGSSEVLLWMPAARPEWPQVLVLQEPVTLPAGTVLTLSTRRSGPSGPMDRVLLSAWPASPR